MDFKIDENMPIEVADLLTQAGYDAITISEQNLIGTTDANLANICQKENRVLVTLDADFADIRTYQPKNFSGIIVMRLNRQDKTKVVEVFRRIIRLFSKEPIEKHLWVVEENRIRVRG
jgi:predicted nuclease of predicted toxin-antitoxin system